jgi:hypothetical protein
MKRFLMLVGVALVAAAMYVAASSASQQSKAPTRKQFLALQKKVTALSKTLKTVKAEANSAVGFIATCLVSTNAGALPTSEFGDTQNATPTFGYQYSADGTNFGFATALDIDGSTAPQGYLQIVDSSCVTASGLRHALTRSGNGFSLARPERLHH